MIGTILHIPKIKAGCYLSYDGIKKEAYPNPEHFDKESSCKECSLFSICSLLQSPPKLRQEDQS